MKRVLKVMEEIAERLLGRSAGAVPLGGAPDGDLLLWKLGRRDGALVVGGARGKGGSLRDLIEDNGEGGAGEGGRK